MSDLIPTVPQTRYTPDGSLIQQYRQGAANRSLVFELTEESFISMVTSPCHYCGWEPRDHFNGIDRINSQLGYIEANCVPCCRWCNMAKGRRPVHEFLEWLNWVQGKPASHPFNSLPERLQVRRPKVRPLRWHNVVRRKSITVEQVEIADPNAPAA